MCTLPYVSSCFHILDFSWSFDCCRPMSPGQFQFQGEIAEIQVKYYLWLKMIQRLLRPLCFPNLNYQYSTTWGVRLNRQRSLFFNTIETKLEFTQEANQIFAFYYSCMFDHKSFCVCSPQTTWKHYSTLPISRWAMAAPEFVFSLVSSWTHQWHSSSSQWSTRTRFLR